MKDSLFVPAFMMIAWNSDRLPNTWFYGALSLWEGELANNKEIHGLQPPTVDESLFSGYNLICMLHNMVYNTFFSPASILCCSRWPDAYLAPGHQQPSRWSAHLLEPQGGFDLNHRMTVLMQCLKCSFIFPYKWVSIGTPVRVCRCQAIT